MKNVVTIFVAIIVFVFFCSQDKDVISDIKAKYQQICQGIKTYTKKTKEDNDQSADGGNITAYYNGKQLQLIVSEYFAEGGKGRIEYYFNDGKLIFVIYKDYTYNRPYYYTEKMAHENNDTAWYDYKKTKVEMNRFYFSNDKVVKWINDKNMETTTETPELLKYKSDILQEVQRLKKSLG